MGVRVGSGTDEGRLKAHQCSLCRTVGDVLESEWGCTRLCVSVFGGVQGRRDVVSGISPQNSGVLSSCHSPCAVTAALCSPKRSAVPALGLSPRSWSPIRVCVLQFSRLHLTRSARGLVRWARQVLFSCHLRGRIGVRLGSHDVSSPGDTGTRLYLTVLVEGARGSPPVPPWACLADAPGCSWECVRLSWGWGRGRK